MTGLTLAQYRIDAELGRGGMGIVYRATDTKLNRSVALKVLPAAVLSSEDDRARFFREAQAAAQLHHPNIATVFGIDEAAPVTADGRPVEGQSERRPFIAMEFIEGETLHEHVKKGPLRLPEAVSIAVQVAEALKAAHAKNIVHRDIKSANVMLTPDGVAKVLDFGLAKTNQSTMLTRMGSTLGTVAYMSPEQARGQEVDGRSDLYSLGTMLYEMVTGRLPFSGDYEQAVVYGILNEPPEPLTGLRTGVPMELERIVGKLLTKEADYRYQGAADLIADLKSLDLTGSGHSRRSVPGATAAGVPVASTAKAALPRWVWPVIGVLGLTTLALAAVALRPVAPTSGPGPVRRFTLDIPDLGYVANVGMSQDGSMFAVAFKPGKILVHTMATGDNVVLDVPGAYAVSWSRDADRLLVGGTGSLIRMRSDGTDRVTVASGAPVYWGIYGPGDEILYTPYSDYVVRVPPTGRQDTLRPPGGAYFPISTTPDGRVVFLNASGITGDEASLIWDPERNRYERLDGNIMTITRSGHGIYWKIGHSEVAALDGSWNRVGERLPVPSLQSGMMLSDDGTLISFPSGTGVDRGRLMVRRPDGDESVLAQEIETGDFALSPDGRRVVYSESGAQGVSTSWVTDLESGIPSRIAEGAGLKYPSWNPTGDLVYGFADDYRTLGRTRADGSEAPAPVYTVTLATGPAEFFPDGIRLLVTAYQGEGGLTQRIVEYDVEADSVVRNVNTRGRGTTPSVSPDGRFVAFTQLEGTSDVITPLTIREVATERTWALPQGRDCCARWSRDGRAIEYRSGDSLMAVPIRTEGGFRATGAPMVVDVLPGLRSWNRGVDGTIVYTQGPKRESSGTLRLQVVVNWFTELERLAPHAQ